MKLFPSSQNTVDIFIIDFSLNTNDVDDESGSNYRPAEKRY